MAYVTSDLGVYPVNLTTGTAGSVISTGPLNGIAILPDGHTAFVAERNADRVRVIDLGTGTVDPTPIPVRRSAVQRSAVARRNGHLRREQRIDGFCLGD